MLFNSYEFIFAFLPVTIAGFYLLGPVSRRWALHWLILASFFFYAWWRPLNVLLIAPSILINFVLARTLQRLVRNEKRRRASLAVLVLGLAFNVAFLGYFKYTYFLGTAINDVFGSNLILTRIILPLGISFITFQKIAFLIDVHSRRIESVTLQDYCLFVLFFPQLIAGPIVHYREMMPQFHGASCRFDKENFAVGLTLLMFGLFKKAVIADGIAPSVTSIYEHAAGGGGVSLLFGLYRHGARGGSVVRNSAAPEFQLTAPGIEHHRLLAALAHDVDAFSDSLHLQSPGTRVDAAPSAKGPSRVRRTQHDGRGLALLLMFPT